MYDRPPTAEEIKSGGYEPGDFEDEDFDVWPENWPTYELFLDMDTQWRVGLSGPTGLDYNVLLRLMDGLHLSDEDHQALFDDVRVMEHAALEKMRKPG